MNYLKVSVCVLSLLCLACLLAPSTMLAQEDGEVPCCYSAPTIQPVLNMGIDTQSSTVLLSTLTRAAASHPMIDPADTTAVAITGDKQIPFLLPEEGFRAIYLRRVPDLMV